MGFNAIDEDGHWPNAFLLKAANQLRNVALLCDHMLPATWQAKDTAPNARGTCRSHAWAVHRSLDRLLHTQQDSGMMWCSHCWEDLKMGGMSGGGFSVSVHAMRQSQQAQGFY